MSERNKQNDILCRCNYLSKYQYVKQHKLEQPRMWSELTPNILSNGLFEKHSLLRVKLSCLGFLLILVSPVQSATQGKMGVSSTASSRITLTVLPKNVNTGSNKIVFDNDSQINTSQEICLRDFKAPIYSVSVMGSGSEGQFELVDKRLRRISYSVFYQDQGGQFAQLNIKSTQRHSQSIFDSNQCVNMQNSRLKVRLDNQYLASGSNYSGYITLTIAAQ